MIPFSGRLCRWTYGAGTIIGRVRLTRSDNSPVSFEERRNQLNLEEFPRRN